MCLLLESIKCLDGTLHGLVYHEARMGNALGKHFGITQKLDLKKHIKIPANAKKGLWKCRIIYNREIQEITFEKYKRKKILSVKLIYDETIFYPHKYLDRDCIHKHTQDLQKGEEIIFVKKGLLRDASYSNIALFNGRKWHTPTYPLLKGTKRAELLNKGLIISKKIRPEHLANYSQISFINALNGLEENCLDL